VVVFKELKSGERRSSMVAACRLRRPWPGGWNWGGLKSRLRESLTREYWSWLLLGVSAWHPPRKFPLPEVGQIWQVRNRIAFARCTAKAGQAWGTLLVL